MVRPSISNMKNIRKQEKRFKIFIFDFSLCDLRPLRRGVLFVNRETQHHDEFISLWCLGVLKISKCHPPKKYDNKILHVGPDDVFWHLVHLTFEIFTYEERTLLHINSLLWCSYIAHLGPLRSCSKNSIREQFYILCSRSKVHI